MGNDGWQYEPMDSPTKRGGMNSRDGGQQEDDAKHMVGVAELRRLIAKLARREDR